MCIARKVIVIGLDGLEFSIAGPMMAAGELPHLSRIASAGGMTRVRTTFPAQTPVAWSTFATGTNPGGHGIFDFLRRDPATYLPDIALNRYEQKNPFLPPRAVNLRRGTPLWKILSDAGVSSTVIRCPCTYPPDDLRGRMLSGMGVPDLRGGFGTSTFYTEVSDEPVGESETVVGVRPDGDGEVQTYLIGPRVPKTGEDAHMPLRIRLDRGARKAVVLSDGKPGVLEVAEGEWSDWLRVKFKLGMLQGVRGMVRFHLVRLDPTLELYASPVNFDPAEPMFPISSPWEYANELARKTGTFYTTGMVEDHTGLVNGRIDEAAYLDQCEQVMAERERMMLYELDRFRDGFFYCLFDTPDRIQHMFWRFREAGHPANAGVPPPTEFVHAIEEHYRRCDVAVGKALAHVDDDTLLIVLSDHGFNSFQRGVHLNAWLRENGFLALKPGVEAGDEAGDMLRHVDWANTRAYALGLGGIYLNLRGREAEGIVSEGATGDLKAEIAGGLTGLVDPIRGQVAVRGVLARESVYSGPFVDEAPDLLTNFSAGYRGSWSTALGGVPAELLEDNVKRWGGDHIIDPSLVPGVLLMNRPFDDDEPGLEDLAPTILSALGVPAGPEMEGRGLL